MKSALRVRIAVGIGALEPKVSLLRFGFGPSSIQMIEMQSRVEEQRIAAQCLMAPHRIDSKKQNVALTDRDIYEGRPVLELFSTFEHPTDEKFVFAVKAE